MNDRNPILAFFLSFIPGVGFLYMDRKFRGTMYLLSFFSMFIVSVFLVFIAYEPKAALIAAFIGAMIFLIQMIDMIVLLLKRDIQIPQQVVVEASDDHSQPLPISHPSSSEQFLTLLLSFIPGLGHFHLGLMNRGLTFLLTFFGSIMMVFFIAILTGYGEFLVFLGISAVIWIFNLVDIVQLLKQKREGQVLDDRTVLEDLEQQRESGKKSRTFAMMLGIFPGAGHMYLGLQKRGLQLMASFLLVIYLIDFMRISLFLFLIPLIWFFSFFDVMQKAAQANDEELEDVPIVSYFVNKQKWLGIGLVLLGIYYLFDRVIKPELFPWLSAMFEVDLFYIYHHYFQVTIVCILLIGGGLKLMLGSKKKGDDAT